MQPVKPAAQHQWLKRLIGTWSFESECSMGPGQPSMRARGRETVRALGDLWIIAEGGGEMPGGGNMNFVMTLGFDPARGKVVGTWLADCMTTMFVYEGELSGNVLPLNASGPSFADPSKIVKYQDVIELPSDDRRVLWSQVLGDDGKWTRFMTANYTRVK